MQLAKMLRRLSCRVNQRLTLLQRMKSSIHMLMKLLLRHFHSVQVMLKLSLRKSGHLILLLTVEEKLSSMVATIGEKLTIRRIELVEGDVVVPYIHGEVRLVFLLQVRFLQ